MYGGSVASSADGIKLMAAQFNGSIYVSTNAGGTWKTTTAPTGKAWTSVASSTDGSNLVAVAFYSGIYTSKNAGATWSQSGAPVAEWTSVASSTNGTVLYAATYDSFLFVSTNAGTTWAQAAGPAYWGPLACSADGVRLAAVANGLLTMSGDTGATWTVATNAPGVPTALASSADGTSLVAAADGGAIYSSRNAGITWQSNAAPATQWSAVASSINGNRLVAGGSLGIYMLPGYDLAIGQSASPPAASPSNNFNFTITITNLGPEDASSVVVTDTLPASVKFAAASPAWTTNSAGVLAFNLSTMTNGAIAERFA